MTAITKLYNWLTSFDLEREVCILDKLLYYSNSKFENMIYMIVRYFTLAIRQLLDSYFGNEIQTVD